MEAVLIVATIAQRWKLELVSHDVAPQASITLRPKGGIRMRVTSPTAASAASEDSEGCEQLHREHPSNESRE